MDKGILTFVEALGRSDVLGHGCYQRYGTTAKTRFATACISYYFNYYSAANKDEEVRVGVLVARHRACLEPSGTGVGFTTNVDFLSAGGIKSSGGGGLDALQPICTRNLSLHSSHLHTASILIYFPT